MKVSDSKKKRGRNRQPLGGEGLSGRARRKRSAPPRPYPAEVKLKAVKLHMEEGFPLRLVAQELGICRDTVHGWVQRYRQFGRAGLEVRPPGRKKPGVPKLPAVVKQKIVEVKQQQPLFGTRRISQWLRRVLFLPASAETVRRTLHEHELLPKTRPKPSQKNPQKPRFFERSTPNQMWQSDIFCFRLGGQNAYLIGFIDDHSRYIVGLDLFRSQTGEHVLEVYRTAAAEYGPPKEMLTDNGRQYASWHGKTRFQHELAKDRIHHLRSAPHHPMTLGKIERFWKTIWEEFLVRAQFDSFESARERVRLWIKYYNHKRPHQSLDGLVPADRFFAIQKQVREVIERGLQENLLELALRGQPKNPFYMVGNLGGQSVVMQVERGQLKMVLDGQNDRPVSEVVYDMESSNEHKREEREEREEQRGEGNEGAEGTHGAQRATEVPGGAGAVDGAAAAHRDLPGDERAGQPDHGLAGTGAGGHAAGVGTAHAPHGGPGTDPGRPAPADAGTQGHPALQPHGAVEHRPSPEGRAGEDPGSRELTACAPPVDGERSHEQTQSTGGGRSRTDDAADHAGTRRDAERDGSGPADGHLPQDLVRAGEPRPAGHERGAGTGEAGPPEFAGRSGNAEAAFPDQRPATAGADPGTTRTHPTDAPGG